MRLCRVRIRGTGQYVGQNDTLTTNRAAAVRMTFDRAEKLCPGRVRQGLEVVFETCLIVTGDTDW